MSASFMPAFSSTWSMARWGPLVPAPTAMRDLATISLPSARMTHLEAVEPMSMPKV